MVFIEQKSAVGVSDSAYRAENALSEGGGDLQGDEGEDVEEKGYLCNGINRSYMDF